ncbi:MAG: porin family protein [Gammaproteobacteria bacterium]
MKTNFITNTIFLLALLSGSTYAATPGFYLGGGAGYSYLQEFSDATNDEASGVGGTLFAGFNFNEYVGIEASYRKYADANYTFDNDSNINFDYQMHSFNLVAKGYLPFGQNNQFNFYGLVGVSKVSGEANINSLTTKNIGSSSNEAMLPTVGFGLNYVINPKVTAGIEYVVTQSQDGDDQHIGIPAADLLSLTLAFHIG